MDRRDDDLDHLDELLAPLRDAPPTELELRRWNAAIRDAQRRQRRARVRIVIFALAACLIGAVVGSALTTALRGEKPCDDGAMSLATQPPSGDATFERLYTKFE
jgi:hypothetical protein